MIKIITEYALKNHLFTKGDSIILACSGGPDSICMVDCFLKIAKDFDLKLFVVHVEHGLRGKESLADCEFVKNFCNKNHLPFYAKHIKVINENEKNTSGIEEKARQMRYEALQDMAKELNCQKIALAHHRGDQAETVLMHLIRGCGLKGLSGILPKSGNLIRPLLSLKRSDIMEYCSKNKLSYCIDKTNFNKVFTRNSIRLDLIPFLSDYNGDIETALCSLASLSAETVDYLNEAANDFLNKYSLLKEKKIYLKIDFLNKEHIALRKHILRSAIIKLNESIQDITSKHIDDILNLIKNNRTGSSISLPHKIKATISYGDLIFTLVDNSKVLELNTVEIKPGNGVFLLSLGHYIQTKLLKRRRKDTKDCCYLDCDKIKGNLYLRYRVDGDYFYPKGIEGHKKLKDLFIDRKIPREERDSWPLLSTKDGSIIWVCGIQLDRRFLPDKNTKNYLKVEYKNFENIIKR